MKRILVSLFVIFFLTIQLNGQKEDHLWLFGSTLVDNVDSTWIQDTTWGSTNIDFNFEPPKVLYDPDRLWDVEGTNGSICDKNGDLLFYTNGQAIYNGAHGIVEDTINYNAVWDNNTLVYQGVTYIRGLGNIQGALFLPFPDDPDKYYLIYYHYDWAPNINKMLYAVIDSSLNTPLVSRDNLIVQDSMGGGGLTACRHANGRDWWLLFPSYYNNTFHTCLIDPQGITYSEKQELGIPYTHSLGQMYFSPKGDKVGINSGHFLGADGANVAFMDFDRCNGKLSNAVADTINAFGVSQGFSFSPSGQYAYASNDIFLYQYDMYASDIIGSKLEVAQYDGYTHEYPEFPNTFIRTTIGWMGLGPDGRIYVSSGTAQNRKMHVMHKPDKLGTDCDFRQHSILLADYIRTIPNYVNFRLGPEDGSGCDTLGVNNLPIAKFRCYQDSTNQYNFEFLDLSFFDPNSWNWTVDGNTYVDQNVEYVFAQDGAYEICLEVSNGNGSNKTCKTIYVGTSSTSNLDFSEVISVFPNPTTDILNITFEEYYPTSGLLEIYSASGLKVMSKKIYSNWSTISLSNIPAGIYFYRVYDGGEVLKTERLVIK